MFAWDLRTDVSATLRALKCGFLLRESFGLGLSVFAPNVMIQLQVAAADLITMGGLG
jgi:hypothetical protein